MMDQGCAAASPLRPGFVAAVVVLFSLVATGQIKLRKIDGWKRIANVVSTKLKETAKQAA